MFQFVIFFVITASVSPASVVNLANDKPVPAETEATEVWYGTAEGVVGVATLQHSSASSEVIPLKVWSHVVL